MPASSKVCLTFSTASRAGADWCCGLTRSTTPVGVHSTRAPGALGWTEVSYLTDSSTRGRSRTVADAFLTVLLRRHIDLAGWRGAEHTRLELPELVPRYYDKDVHDERPAARNQQLNQRVGSA